MKDNKIIVVLGMHRSGTSAIARGLEVLGVKLGDDLYPAAIDNPKGFWEDRSFLDINEELLAHLGSAYDRLGLINWNMQNVPAINLIHLKAEKLVREKCDQNTLWGFKDPRTARLLPFWQSVFEFVGCDVGYVIVIRNPLSIVDSLCKRNDFEPEKTFYLWLEHLIPAIVSTKGAKRIVVDYDQLLENPRVQLLRMARALELPAPEPLALAVYVNQFLEGGLRHTFFTTHDLYLYPSVPSQVIIGYDWLVKLAKDNVALDSIEVEQIFDTLSRDLVALSPALNFMARQDQQISAISQAEQSIVALQVQVQDLLTGNAWMTSQRDAWLNEANDLKHTLSEMIVQRDACRFEINHLKQSLSDKDKQVEELDKQLEELEEKLRNSEALIAEIFASTSWKATEPLRTLMHFVKKQGRLPPQYVRSATQQIVESELSLIASKFDAEFYRKAYPDIGAGDPFFHYSKYGKNEGRLFRAPDPHEIYELKNIDRAKETILIVSHDASRSGAPILALNIVQHLKEKYNIIALLLNGGDLLTDFQECCDIVIEPFPHSYNLYIASSVLIKLISEVGLKFALVNSIVSNPVLPLLAHNFVPSLCLIHEFASYTNPKNTIREVLFWASQVVFSARIVYENNAAQCKELKERIPVILPQGKCEVPHIKKMEELDDNKKQRIRKLFRPDSLPDDTVVILGAGSVQLRKGVDLFLACAARVVGLHPQNTFRFVWVGHGFDPDFDRVYSVYLQDQIIRSGLENHVCFTGEMLDIDMAYELSDLFLLSSRLDPMPNVAIDAMYKQLPVICFDSTTGIADILKENGLGESCVIPYLDVEQAAQRLVALIDNSDLRNKLGKDVLEVGKNVFDMISYVDSLERLAMDCVVMQDEERRDCILIEKDGALDIDFFLPSASSALSYKEAVRTFVRSWKSGIDRREPFSGFNPGIFEDCHQLSQTGRNPLAAFIEAGKPKGPGDVG